MTVAIHRMRLTVTKRTSHHSPASLTNLDVEMDW